MLTMTTRRRRTGSIALALLSTLVAAVMWVRIVGQITAGQRARLQASADPASSHA